MLGNIADGLSLQEGLFAARDQGPDAILFALLSGLSQIRDPRQLSAEQLEQSERAGQLLLNRYSENAKRRAVERAAKAKQKQMRPLIPSPASPGQWFSR